MEPIDRCSELARDLQRALPGLAGAYVHGSVALGGFVPGRSDIDLLFVCDEPLSAREAHRFASVLASKGGCPGSGVESSLLTRAQAGAPESGAFELHVCTGPDAKVVSGHGHKGDPDLVLHALVTLAAGVTLFGPPPLEVFAVPSRQVVFSRLKDELRWALAHGSGQYAVLNAARAALWAEEGRVASKLEGGDWAAVRFPAFAPLVEAALSAQPPHDGPPPTHGDAAFVAFVLDELEGAGP